MFMEIKSMQKKEFNYIYEPFSKDGGITEDKYVYKIINDQRNVIYIPTQLNYIDGKSDCQNMINKIDNLDKKQFASFSYHPYIEFDDIKTYRENDGYPNYDYSYNSVLHKVVNKLKHSNYKFCTINEIN